MERSVLIFILCCMMVGMTGCGGRKTAQPEEITTDTVVAITETKMTEAVKPDKDDPVIGIFVCDETNERYRFYDDGTGGFCSGGQEHPFTWKHNREMVILNYELTGKQYLHYDAKKRLLQEDSELYGGIINFRKTV